MKKNQKKLCGSFLAVFLFLATSLLSFVSADTENIKAQYDQNYFALKIEKTSPSFTKFQFTKKDESAFGEEEIFIGVTFKADEKGNLPRISDSRGAFKNFFHSDDFSKFIYKAELDEIYSKHLTLPELASITLFSVKPGTIEYFEKNKDVFNSLSIEEIQSKYEEKKQPLSPKKQTGQKEVSVPLEQDSIDFIIDQLEYNAYGKKHTLSVAPYVSAENRTLLPLRAVGEAFNAEVSWDSKTRTVTLTSSDKTIALKIGDAFMYVNTEKITLDSPASIKEGRTFLPIRSISEAFDTKVKWIAEEKRVHLSK